MHDLDIGAILFFYISGSKSMLSYTTKFVDPFLKLS